MSDASVNRAGGAVSCVRESSDTSATSGFGVAPARFTRAPTASIGSTVS